MPFNIWCDGCQNHIGMGVRYNAEKKKVGTYYTTPVYRFRMKCHLCVNYIELQTDPGNCDYVIVSGARRKEERWDPGDSAQVLPTTPEQRERLAMDPMFRLEHGVTDRGVLERATPTLTRLQEAQDAWKDDFGLNRRLRGGLRAAFGHHRVHRGAPGEGPEGQSEHWGARGERYPGEGPGGWLCHP
ncbi:PREDICTED: coiled-coil domain-containing protein 130 [Corvus brachyrhynchos]|uniref:coiled-coil domain-containing protein 130 n=1 Tax=Corvus brachyrhynchos TaxID=85066 RepID=UPI00081654B5|nr:PREDICTED: coiled-coil domain-containing protein 130 [Corvus brachyrhynchos]